MIRHGQSLVNLEGWNQGNTDEGLTDLGQRQAAALAHWLPTKLPTMDILYCSTMRRALETAAPLCAAYNITLQREDRLREVGNNRLDHSPYPNDDLPRDYADYWGSERPFNSITPAMGEGESWMHFRTRVGSFLEEIVQRHRQQTVVAVCHGGVVEAAFDHIFNVGPWRRCEVWLRNSGITQFEYVEHPRRETWRLHYH
ncbi:MAG: histidine phosphatase family protein, partial [Anaerolineae bacterium]